MCLFQKSSYIFLFRGIGENDSKYFKVLTDEHKQIYDNYAKEAYEEIGIDIINGIIEWDTKSIDLELSSWIVSHTLDCVVSSDKKLIA